MVLTSEERKEAVKGIKEGEYPEKKEGFFSRKAREYKEIRAEFKKAKAEAREPYIAEQHEKRLEHARELGKKAYYKPFYKEVAKGTYNLGLRGLGQFKSYTESISKKYKKPIRQKQIKRKSIRWEPIRQKPFDFVGFNTIYGQELKKQNVDMMGFPIKQKKKGYDWRNFGKLRI